MKIVNPNSLAATLDALNEASFYKRALSEPEKTEAARWIASRQGLPGSYASMFGPTEMDFRGGARLFTGEQVRSRAGTAHILGEEACRALILLDVPDGAVRGALAQATSGMMGRLLTQTGEPKAVEPRWRTYNWGTYCCGTCSAAYWRHLAAGGLQDPESRLAAGMAELAASRKDDGRWRRFPFHYTLLALNEIGLPSAVEEMRYAALTCEVLLRQAPKDDKFDQRRRTLAERILGKC